MEEAPRKPPNLLVMGGRRQEPPLWYIPVPERPRSRSLGKSQGGSKSVLFGVRQFCSHGPSRPTEVEARRLAREAFLKGFTAKA